MAVKPFIPISDNPDLSIHESPMQPRTAIVCRWKDAHRFRRKHPDVSVVGPLRTVRGIDLLFRSLLANPQIHRVYVEGVDLTPNKATTQALFDTWRGDNSWLQDDVVPHADHVRAHVDLVEMDGDNIRQGLISSERALKDPEPLVLPPPVPKAGAAAPHGDPGERVSGDTVADVWPRALKQAMGFGLAVPTQYGETREVLNLVSVIRNPSVAHELPDWIPGHDQVEVYARRLFVDRKPPEGAKYSYSSRLHDQADGKQLINLDRMLKDNPLSRAAYVTPWNTDTDSGLESGRPCMVGAWFRYNEDALHLTVMFRSHDLFGAYPLNLAAACQWLHYMAEARELPVGTLTCISCSAHVYDRDYASAEEIVGEKMGREIHWDPRSTWSITCVPKDEERQLQAVALSPDGSQVLEIFVGRTPAAVRAKIQNSGLIQSMANAMWVGDELRRVYEAKVK